MPKPTLRTKGIAQYFTLCWASFPALSLEVGFDADEFEFSWKITCFCMTSMSLHGAGSKARLSAVLTPANL